MKGKLIDYTKERGVLNGATRAQTIKLDGVSFPRNEPHKQDSSTQSNKNPSMIEFKRDESLDAPMRSWSSILLDRDGDGDDSSATMYSLTRSNARKSYEESSLQLQTSSFYSHERQVKPPDVMIEFQLRIPPKSQRRSSQSSTNSSISDELREKLQNSPGRTRFSKPRTRKRSKTPVIDSVFKEISSNRR